MNFKMYITKEELDLIRIALQYIGNTDNEKNFQKTWHLLTKLSFIKGGLICEETESKKNS